jgi:hypothetical protein
MQVMNRRAELVRPLVVGQDSGQCMDQPIEMAAVLVKGRNGAGGCQEGAMAARSSRAFMSLFLHLMLQWVGVIESAL